MVKLSKYSDKNTPAILVEIGGVKLWFSYETVIAFQISSQSPLIVSQNQWGPTTGRHLDLIDNGKGKRLPRGEFERELDKLQAQLNPTVNHAAVAEIEAEADQLWREANGPDGESDD